MASCVLHIADTPPDPRLQFEPYGQFSGVLRWHCPYCGAMCSQRLRPATGFTLRCGACNEVLDLCVLASKPLKGPRAHDPTFMPGLLVTRLQVCEVRRQQRRART